MPLRAATIDEVTFKVRRRWIRILIKCRRYPMCLRLMCTFWTTIRTQVTLEPGLPAFAPANAIYDLTGERIRKLTFNFATV